MKRLHYFNLFGVALLAVLCVVQWRQNRELNLAFNRLEKNYFEQETRGKDQDKKLTGLSADLEEFRSRFSKADTEAHETQRKLTVADRQIQQLTLDKDQLKQSVTNWAAAVTLRDERQKESNGRIVDLGRQLNDSVLKYNDLATNYSASVTRYNTLATNYNNVVGQLNDARTKLAAALAAAEAARPAGK